LGERGLKIEEEEEEEGEEEEGRGGERHGLVNYCAVNEMQTFVVGLVKLKNQWRLSYLSV